MSLTVPEPAFYYLLSINILLTAVWLIFKLQYFSIRVFTTVSIFVNKLDNCFAVHLLEPAMKANCNLRKMRKLAYA